MTSLQSLNKAAIYLITHHQFNHEGEGKKPLDRRFLESDRNYIFYLIDKTVPKCLQNKTVIQEKDVDLDLHKAGAKYFAEWSFLLAEEKHRFCNYPFFMISSRFYQKNHWLRRDLDQEWENLFSFLDQYGWGFLPSYDRPLNWIDLSKVKKKKDKYGNRIFFPFTDKGLEAVEETFQINLFSEYRRVPDLFCNYIGFKSREHLQQYVQFYRPLIDYFFDERFEQKKCLNEFVERTGHFKNEKPFTFLLELFSHLFFYKMKKRYFAIHYDGYHEIDAVQGKFHKLHSFDNPFFSKIGQNASWMLKKLKNELKLVLK